MCVWLNIVRVLRERYMFIGAAGHTWGGELGDKDKIFAKPTHRATLRGDEPRRAGRWQRPSPLPPIFREVADAPRFAPPGVHEGGEGRQPGGVLALRGMRACERAGPGRKHIRPEGAGGR